MVRTDEALTTEQISRVLHAVRADCDWANEIRRAKGGTHFDHHGSPPPDADAICYETYAEGYRDDLADGRIDGVRDEIREYTRRFDLAIKPGSVDEIKVGKAILTAYADSCEASALECRNLPKDTSDPAIIAPLTSGEHAQNQPGEPIAPRSGALTPEMKASEAWTVFIADKQQFDGWTDVRKATSSLNLWVATFEDKPIATWTSQQANELRRLFRMLPGKYGRASNWNEPGNIWTIAEAFQQELSKLKKTNEAEWRELASTATKFATWNRHWTYLNGFWVWAAGNGLIPAGSPNPFDKLFVDVDDELPPWEGGSEDRKMWELEQRVTLFASPLFTGYKSHSERWISGSTLDQDALYWVVLVIAHSGMRREELCQLHVKHVVQDADTGIWYFDLKAPGLRLKRPESKRWIPLHDVPIKLGFLTRRVLRRDSEERLFPELTPGVDQRLGDDIGEDFLEYRRAYDEHRQSQASDKPFVRVYEHLLDLHSWRHTVVTLLLRAGVYPGCVEEVVGQKSPARTAMFGEAGLAAAQARLLAVAPSGDTLRIYNKGGTLRILKDAIDKLDLGINVDRLIEAAHRPA